MTLTDAATSQAASQNLQHHRLHTRVPYGTGASAATAAAAQPDAGATDVRSCTVYARHTVSGHPGRVGRPAPVQQARQGRAGQGQGICTLYMGSRGGASP